MASRAHVFHDYSPAHPGPRTRRNAQYRSDEPVELPRSSSWELNGGLLIAAAAACALVAGVTYTTYSPGASPTLAETPAAPLVKSWQPDPQVTRAQVTELLSGPASAVRERAASSASTRQDDSPLPTATRREVLIDDSSPGAQQSFPQTSPSLAPLVPDAAPSAPADVTPSTPPEAPTAASPSDGAQNPYPNPTTTPPDGVAPNAAPETPTHALDPQNPY